MPILLHTPQIKVDFIGMSKNVAGDMQDLMGSVSADFTIQSMICHYPKYDLSLKYHLKPNQVIYRC